MIHINGECSVLEKSSPLRTRRAGAAVRESIHGCLCVGAEEQAGTVQRLLRIVARACAGRSGPGRKRGSSRRYLRLQA